MGDVRDELGLHPLALHPHLHRASQPVGDPVEVLAVPFQIGGHAIRIDPVAEISLREHSPARLQPLQLDRAQDEDDAEREELENHEEEIVLDPREEHEKREEIQHKEQKDRKRRGPYKRDRAQKGKKVRAELFESASEKERDFFDQSAQPENHGVFHKRPLLDPRRRAHRQPEKEGQQKQAAQRAGDRDTVHEFRVL